MLIVYGMNMLLLIVLGTEDARYTTEILFHIITILMLTTCAQHKFYFCPVDRDLSILYCNYLLKSIKIVFMWMDF